MSHSLNTSAPQLREALYMLSLERDVPDAETLEAFVRRYPQFAQELTQFAIDLAIESLLEPEEEPEVSIDLDNVDPVIAKAMGAFQNGLKKNATETAGPQVDGQEAAANPFKDLSRETFRAVAQKIGGTTAFLVKLRDRLIEPATIPQMFIQSAAQALGVSIEALNAYLKTPPTIGLAAQHYKADGKPSIAGQQSFEDALRTSGLTAEQQQRLMNQ
jgi:hypothetical protein